MKKNLNNLVAVFATFAFLLIHLPLNAQDPTIVINNETDTIRSVAISDDGMLIAASAKDALLKIWDAQTGELQYTFTHREYIQGLTFQPGTKLLFAIGLGGTLRAWDLETGLPREKLDTEYPKVEYLNFTPDGKSLITISSKSHRRMIEFWDIEKWRRAKKKEERIDFVSFTPKGIIGIELNVNPYKKRIGFMMMPSLGWKKPGDGYRNDVQHWERGSRRHAIASNGKMMATNLSPTDQILIYDLNQQVQLRKFEGGGQIYTLSFDTAGKNLISGSLDGGIRTWNMGTGKILSTTQLPEGFAVTALTINPKAQIMVVGDSGGSIRTWKTNN